MRSLRWTGTLIGILAGILHFSCIPQVRVPKIGEGVARKWEPKGEIEPERYICYRTAGSLVMDGKLDEVSWERAPWTGYFVDIEGDLKPRPRFETRAKMLWDEDYFYVAAEMEEPDVWATLTQRDTVIFYDNDFEVFIDPDGDTHEYYEFEINAFNTGWDLFLVKAYRDGGPAVTAWDIVGLETAVQVDGTLNRPEDVDRGWSVELAFPWEILRQCAHKPAPPKQGDQWRVNFSRVERLRGSDAGDCDNWVWSPQGLINMHYPEMWGYVQFSTKVVGEEEGFVMHPEEEAKKILRGIYYKQRGYYGEHGRYTDELKALGIEEPELVHYRWPPELQITDSLFEVSMEEKRDVDRDGRLNRWHIRQDSKTWKD